MVGIEEKCSIIGSIYPEKICFDGIAYRTGRVNGVAHIIYLINTPLGSKKNRTKLDFSSLSDSVDGTGQTSNFLEDMQFINAYANP
jgi:site-specific DNA recombinase